MPVYLGSNKVASAGGNVTTVLVDFSGCSEGTQYFFLGYGQCHDTGFNEFYSIESPVSEYICFAPYGAKAYTPVCLPPSSDNFNALILFNQQQHDTLNFTTTGNVDTTMVLARERWGVNTWNSSSLYGFVVHGSGSVVVTPK